MNIQTESLHGRRIWVTRPAHQNAPLCALIEQAGGSALALPALDILPPLDPAAVRVRLQQLDNYDMGVFISRNAVDNTLKLVHPGKLPAGTDWLAIGRATAAALQASGYPVALMPDTDFSSEGLLALPQLEDVRGKRIVIIRGEGGRELLAKGFRQRGAHVEYIETYRRICPSVTTVDLQRLFAGGKPDLVTATSSLLVQYLLRIIGVKYRADILRAPLIVLGERTRRHALQLGFTRVYVAEQSDDRGILQKLIEVAAKDP